MTYLIEALPSGDTPQRQREKETAHKLLLQLVGCYCTVEHEPSGSPYLPERPDLKVSISHCRTAVAVAVSDEGSVGIDIECRRRVSRSLMERVCTAEELAAIEASDDPEMAFLRFWTRKEAVLKCRRTGIKGFGSMTEASMADDCEVTEIETGLPDVVASIAMAAGESANRRD